MLKLAASCFTFILCSSIQLTKDDNFNNKIPEEKINFQPSERSPITPSTRIMRSTQKLAEVIDQHKFEPQIVQILSDSNQQSVCHDSQQKKLINKKKTQLLSSQRILQKASNKETIRKKIFSWMEQPVKSDLTFNNLIHTIQILDTRQKKCKLKIYDYSNPTEDFYNLQYGNGIVYPGSFLQGKNISSESQIQIFSISGTYRNPITITQNRFFTPIQAASSQPPDVHRKIKELMKRSQGFELPLEVHLKFYAPQQNFQLKKLFNEKFFRKSIAKTNSYFIVLIQTFVVFSADNYAEDGSIITDPIETFFNQNLSIQILQTIQNAGYWGKDNIPCYISQVTYGRMIIIVAEQNERNKKLFKQFNEGISVKESQNISIKIKQIFQDSSIRVFSLGSFNKDQVVHFRAGNWKIFQLPIGAQNFANLQPIKFKIKDFKGRYVRASNRFPLRKAQKIVKIVLFDVPEKATISVKKTGFNDFAKWKQVTQGTHSVDITSQLTQGKNDSVKIQISGARKKNFPENFSPRVSKTRLIIFIDGVRVYDDQTQCQICKQSLIFQCAVNKYAGTLECKKL